MVKADAYGLGAAAVAPALWRAGCRTFFVAQLDEGAGTAGACCPTRRSTCSTGSQAGEVGDLHRGAAAARCSTSPASSGSGQRRRGAPSDGCAAAHPARHRHVPPRPGRGRARGAGAGARSTPSSSTLVMSHLACADEPAKPDQSRRSSRASSAAAPPACRRRRRSLANSSGMLPRSRLPLRPAAGPAPRSTASTRPPDGPIRCGRWSALEAPVLQVHDVDAARHRRLRRHLREPSRARASQPSVSAMPTAICALAGNAGQRP